MSLIHTLLLLFIAIHHKGLHKNFSLWVKIWIAGCWENFLGSGKKKGGGNETKNHSSDSLSVVKHIKEHGHFGFCCEGIPEGNFQ